MLFKFKQLAGVLLKDSARYRRALTADTRAENGDPLWVQLCNRTETLEVNPNGRGVRCQWKWTSDLHACSVLPAYGRQLAARAFSDWPIEFQTEPHTTDSPLVSFIIAHEGHERIDHLQWVARSIFAQHGTATECIVIDQSAEPRLQRHLPAAVRYFHRPRPEGIDGWRKSWALNQGARQAAGEILVFHDGDIVCPAGYAQTLVRNLKDYGAASIQRFLFNLSKTDTLNLFSKQTWPSRVQPERVRQNWEGGTIAVRRDSFFELGGYDEAFVGWGGEDNEFFDRCRVAGHLRYGFVPFIHLWHPIQTDKHAASNRNITHVLDARLQIPAEQRCAELRQRSFGHPENPDPLTGYREQTRQLAAGS